jgi:hypothetical protein
MLYIFMSFLWGTLKEFSDRQMDVLPELFKLVRIANRRASRKDERLQEFEHYLSRKLGGWAGLSARLRAVVG